MYSKVNYTIVGLFVLLFGIGMAAFAFWLAKYGFKQHYDVYKIYTTESVAGLSKDSVVKLHGVDVGRVKEIRIDPENIERVEILLNIKEDILITEDMVAHTVMLGVTGLLSIEIEGGTNEAKRLKPTPGYIPVIRTKPSWINTAKHDLGTLVEKLNTLTTQADKLLDDKNVALFGEILENTRDVTRKSVSVMDEANATLVSYREAIVNINRDLETATKDFSHITDATIPAVKTLTETTLNFNRLTLKVEKSLDRGDYNIKKIFEPLLVNIEILSDQVNAMAKEFEESPSDIFFKARKTRHGPGE
jgi:phospholipid/cholesterol/gamma-HCH transport system substrate-binding protein